MQGRRQNKIPKVTAFLPHPVDARTTAEQNSESNGFSASSCRYKDDGRTKFQQPVVSVNQCGDRQCPK